MGLVGPLHLPCTVRCQITSSVLFRIDKMSGLTVIALLVAFTVSANAVSVRPDQSIGVRGQLKCKGRPASGVLVKLYDHDSELQAAGLKGPLLEIGL